MPGDDRPIGVFDSGMGGLTVLRALLARLPSERFVYLGDTARLPYGTKSPETVQAYALQATRLLVSEGVKMVVIACNTASAVALGPLAQALAPVPVIGVIEPAVRAAARATRNGRVGLVGTEATVSSGSYPRAIRRAGVSFELIQRACPRFVEFVELGDTTSDDLMDLAREYLAPLQDEGIDTLILGCTHYPLLRGAIQYVMGPDVLLISSAEETASDVYEVLRAKGLLREAGSSPRHRFQSSGDPRRFAELGAMFLGPEVRGAERVALESVEG
jgi:glutamate racemase